MVLIHLLFDSSINLIGIVQARMVRKYLINYQIVRRLSILLPCDGTADIGMMIIADDLNHWRIPAHFFNMLLKGIGFLAFVVKQTYSLSPRGHTKLICELRSQFSDTCTMFFIGLHYPMVIVILE